MAKKRGTPENLKPFVKGEDERRNLEGRPQGSQSLKTIFDKLLNIVVDTEDLDGLPIRLTAKEAIALKQLQNAIKGADPNVQLKAAKQIFEHTDPITKEVNQTVDMTVNGQNELTAEQTDALIKHLQG